eukprot:CAMPEP_0118944600 /NCGR_PEP_ID=MMETSP1169-20130426/40611_1 /TAXON_ID=36882 /ORGANISM="Pyramimonas obovata, Strain CCMP722" /LENGTH=331 /DNA_ID=CAMNT_0006890111 /DNA_START=77 /DNA_END=1068 /DNA_ORIENTATION=+
MAGLGYLSSFQGEADDNPDSHRPALVAFGEDALQSHNAGADGSYLSGSSATSILTEFEQEEGPLIPPEANRSSSFVNKATTPRGVDLNDVQLNYGGSTARSGRSTQRTSVSYSVRSFNTDTSFDGDDDEGSISAATHTTAYADRVKFDRLDVQGNNTVSKSFRQKQREAQHKIRDIDDKGRKTDTVLLTAEGSPALFVVEIPHFSTMHMGAVQNSSYRIVVFVILVMLTLIGFFIYALPNSKQWPDDDQFYPLTCTYKDHVTPAPCPPPSPPLLLSPPPFPLVPPPIAPGASSSPTASPTSTFSPTSAPTTPPPASTAGSSSPPTGAPTAS